MISSYEDHSEDKQEKTETLYVDAEKKHGNTSFDMPIYFGLQFMNDPGLTANTHTRSSQTSYNTVVHPDLIVYATKDIVAGEELFLNYSGGDI